MTQNLSQASTPEKSTRNGRRYLAVWFPYLPTDRHRLSQQRRGKDTQADQPLVIIDKIKGALRIIAVDSRAAALGLAAGMTLADAEARTPDLKHVFAEVEADRAFLKFLAVDCERFTPSANCQSTDGIILDITGCTHLHGGEAAYAKAVQRCMAGFGVTLRTSMADTPEAAAAFVRFSNLSSIPPGKTRIHACALPVSALEADAATLTALTRAGLKTLGDLLSRPSAMLSARFGEKLTRHLQRIAGEEDLRITPLRRDEPCMSQQVFAEPLLHQDAIELVMQALLQDLTRQLAHRNQGVRLLEAMFFRVSGRKETIAIHISRPSRDARLMLKLFHEKLQGLTNPLDPGYGFDVIRLCATRTDVLSPQQVSTDLATSRAEAADASFHQLVDALSLRYGDHQLQRFMPYNSHVPERAVRANPATMDARPTHPWALPSPAEPPLRPLHMFDPPQPVETVAQVPDGPPLRFRWRNVLHDVVHAEGPERIAPEWWRTPHQRLRDYYRVEDDTGHRFWIFREGFYGATAQPPKWFLHGIFA